MHETADDVGGLAARLASTDPQLRFEAVRALADLAERGPVDAELLAASIEAAAAGPPRPNQGGAYCGELHRAWTAVARRTPAAAGVWYRSVLDTLAGLDLADPGAARRAVELVSRAGGAGAPGSSPYAPLLREHVDRLCEVLLGWAAQPERELFAAVPGMRRGYNTFAALIRDLAGFATAHTRLIGDEDLTARVAVLVPRLMAGHPVTRLGGYLRLLHEHPEPERALAEVIDVVVRACPPDDPWEAPRWSIGEVLLENGDFKLPALAKHLRPYAAAWSDEGLDALVREALFARSRGDDLVRRMRRSAGRRAVPAMLAAQGRGTPDTVELADAVAAAKTRPAAVAPAAGGGVPFADLNLKLAVIDELMYRQSVLTPAFDVRRFAKAYEGREIDVESEGYDAIAEVLEHFDRLPLTAADLAHVTELCFEGGNEVYSQVAPFWDGEDGRFEVRSFTDVVHLPNLRRVELMGFAAAGTDLSPLHDRGITVE